MRVGVVAPTAAEATLGGLDRAVEGLVEAVNEESPHEGELVRVPVAEHDLASLVAAYEACARLDVSRFDVVVTTKYPVWMLEHPNHVVYLFHRLRGLYDAYGHFGAPERVDYDDGDLRDLQRVLRGTPTRAAADEVFERFRSILTTLGSGDPALAFPGPLAREIVHFLDAIALSPDAIRRFFALSKTVASRHGYFPDGVDVEVVYAPSSLTGLRSRAFRHFFTVSRLDVPKRIDLVVGAMAHVRADVPLTIAGAGPDLERLRQVAGGDPRISFVGPVSDTDLVDLYADALAVPFVPSDEDYGLVALEAMSSGKPVVTCHDSGGVTELVVDGVTGAVTDPDPEAIGRTLERLARNPPAAERLGRTGRERALRVRWHRTIRALLRDAPRPRRSAAPRRAKVAVAATFRIHPARHGGQLRLFHLLRALADRYDVEVVTLAESGAQRARVTVAPGLVQTVVPTSPEHARAEAELSSAVLGLPVTDVAASELIAKTPAYLEALGAALDGARGVVLSHPYLVRALDELDARVPLVYEAQDVESELKRALLPETPHGNNLWRTVHAVEAAAVRHATLVTACTTADVDALVEKFGADASRFAVIPNGADIAAIPFVSGAARAHARARWIEALTRVDGIRPARDMGLFLGSGHPPNVDAAERVVASAGAHPEMLFVLAGDHCGAFVRRTLPTNVFLAGVVSATTKRTLLGAASVALNPVAIGSGTNLKVIEYLAAGVPTVTTEIGARGLPADGETPVVIAGCDSLAAAIDEALADEAAASIRARRGRELAERLDWAVLGQRFADAVADALVPAR